MKWNINFTLLDSDILLAYPLCGLCLLSCWSSPHLSHGFVSPLRWKQNICSLSKSIYYFHSCSPSLWRGVTITRAAGQSLPAGEVRLTCPEVAAGQLQLSRLPMSAPVTVTANTSMTAARTSARPASPRWGLRHARLYVRLSGYHCISQRQPGLLQVYWYVASRQAARY